MALDFMQPGPLPPKDLFEEFARLLAQPIPVGEPRKLPAVLSPEEVARLLDVAPGLKYKELA